MTRVYVPQVHDKAYALMCALFDEFLKFRLIKLGELEDDRSMMSSRGEHVFRIGANLNCRLDLSL